MRLLAALVFLALPGRLCLQEDAKLKVLLEKLDDDSIEVRASAATLLAELGPSVLPALRVAAAAAGPELRERLAEVVRKIQDRERLAAILPKPTCITLDAKDRPLREVFSRLSRQTGTPIDFSNIPEDAKVTVSLDRVPFWKALDRVCQAHGGASVEMEPDHVVIAPGPYVSLPGRLTDLFSVTLQRIELSTEVAFGQQQDRTDRFSAALQVSWEKGTHPYRVSARLLELVDESGNEIVSAADETEPDRVSPITPDSIRQEFFLTTERGPGPQTTRIARLKAQVVVEFPIRYAQVKLDLAPGKLPSAGETPEFAVKLLRFERQDGELTAKLLFSPRDAMDGDFASDSVLLRDTFGKEYPAIVTQEQALNENEIPYQAVFQGAPHGGATFTEIVVRIPVEIHRERITVELKDLPLN